jgi:hypothetical protein
MMQASLFDVQPAPPPAWPDGWSIDAIIDEPTGYGQQLRRIEYKHASGAKVAAESERAIDDGRFLRLNIHVWLTVEPWCELWLNAWSVLGTVSASGDGWTQVIEQTEAEPSDECPAVYGQWIPIRKLIQRLSVEPAP